MPAYFAAFQKVYNFGSLSTLLFIVYLHFVFFQDVSLGFKLEFYN